VTSYDVVVAGLGGVGSAAAAELARRGLRVLGLDRNPAGHVEGSSHGESRIVRRVYFEGAGYRPLLELAYERWDALADQTGAPLLRRTGALFLGPTGGRVMTGSLATASAWDVPHDVLDPSEVQARFPAFRPPPGTVALLEPDAGVVPPERAVAAQLARAARAGADLRHGEGLLGWDVRGETVRVRTDRGSHRVGSLVLAPGRWAGDLLPGLAPLRVERRRMHWFDPADPGPLDASRCPVWIWDREDGTTPYGVPVLGPGAGAKTGLHHSSLRPPAEWTPDQLAGLLEPLLPGLGRRHLRAADCWYTLTPDEHFVVGRHPAHERVVVACGFSGHGFKFTPVLGEVLADLAVGAEPGLPLGLFDPGRFTVATEGGGSGAAADGTAAGPAAWSG
jgi:sarcosine oxidase